MHVLPLAGRADSQPTGDIAKKLGGKQIAAVCTSAASLGGTETLITHPASMFFSHQSPDQLASVGVEPGL
jgi:O-acetylhomoserine/O-acetylserine sulfhydrylase-like pyridoxal-dependent enzyme